MITEKEYLEAQKIVDSYKEQLNAEKVALNKARLDAQERREDECDEHYFLEDGKWSSTRSCQFCGKRI